MFRVRSAKSVSVVTTRSLAAWAGHAASTVTATMAAARHWNNFDFISLLMSILLSGLAGLPAMRVRADDPRPLQINRVVGGPVGRSAVIGMGVLQTQEVPVTDREGDVR